jgi:RNA polymerase sigma factor (sigma-70 family)
MPENSEISVKAWKSLRDGDEKGFYTCFHCCYDDLYHLGLFLYKDHELVKESIHLLFIELWKIKEKLPAVTNIKEYTLTIFKRILYKQKTGAVNHWTKIDIIDDEVLDAQFSLFSYEQILINSQEDSINQNRLALLIDQLSDRQKQLIRLRYLDEKTIAEISADTGLTARTIYNTLQNALLKLKELFG